MNRIIRTISILVFQLSATAFVPCLAQSIANDQSKPYSIKERKEQPIETCIQPAAGKVPRSKINFNRNWKFQLGDHKGAENADFNDDNWQNTGLPHSFSIPYFLSADFYIGYGWYRKHFMIPAGYKNKKFFLEFEAAFQQAEVFVNNNKVGEHKGGYTGFSIDITDAVKEGENVVAVKVNNLWNAGLAPRAGEHVFSGGIYRDVYLVITNPVHVDWYGTFVSTPLVSEKSATVNIKTEIRNDGNEDRMVKLNTDIIDEKGKLVVSFYSQKKVAAGSVEMADQTGKPVPRPALWHPDHPYLYTAVTTLLVNNKVTDQYRTTFGIRSVQWTADKGLFINGKHLYLRGANVHQDHAGWGDAVTNAGFYRDVKLIKEAGFNFIRGSHYPHDPAFADACDRLGILFWSENAFWGIGGSGRTPEGYWNSSAYPTKENDRLSFEASVKQQLQEMIRIHRNHPSIFVWSMSNEPFFTAPQTIKQTRNLLKDLVNISHLTDPTRMAAIGGSQRPLDSNRIDGLGDVAGYNGDGATISVFQHPGIPSVISEYGSTTAERPGNYKPGWGGLAADSGKAVHAWRSGQAIWCAFDHGSIAGSALGKMGIIDYFRIPKKAWYWYRNEYAHIPPPQWPQPGIASKLKLVADGVTAAADGTTDIKLNVTVLDINGKRLSNDPPVQLTIVSGPGEFPTGTSINFEAGSDIRIMDGEASIECRSWYAGKSVIRATSPGLQSAELTLHFTGDIPYKEGITPRSTDRLYVRFNKKAQPVIQQTFGRDNPTFASSSQSEHQAGFAADGNSKTWWQPLPGDSSAWWVLDTEKKLAISKIKISFPGEGVYQYKIEIADNQNWKLIADFMNNQEMQTEQQLTLPGLTGTSVRIRFKNAEKAMLNEVEVTGKVLE